MDGNIPQNHPKSDADTINTDGPSRKRSRRSKNNNSYKTDECYSNVSYQERNSSGRPGSPHRYFEHSYDVSFLTDSVASTAATGSTDEQIVVTAAAAKASSAATVDSEQQQEEKEKEQEEQSTKTIAGQQVVHRHVNGLCIVTAGNVLQLATTATTSLQEKSSSNAESSDKSQQQQQHQHQQSLAISSIKYLVKVAPDAQSAKGKLRAKNKKRRKNNNSSNINSGSMKSNIDNSSQSQAEDINNYDGEVSPTDPLCEVHLSNGTKITLQCCVHGTVIELNHRIGDSNESVEDETNVESSSKRGGGNNASLLVTDPLLDGYLAVIMPNRGSYLPTVTHYNQSGGSEK